MKIISGKHKSASGTVDALVFQLSIDYPNEHNPSYHVLLGSRIVVTVNVKQVEALHLTR